MPKQYLPAIEKGVRRVMNEGAIAGFPMEGIKVVEIPFKGTPEVIAAILSRNVDGYWAPISAGLSNIKSGKLRALAVTTAKRSSTV